MLTLDVRDVHLDVVLKQVDQHLHFLHLFGSGPFPGPFRLGLLFDLLVNKNELLTTIACGKRMLKISS